MAAVRPTRSRAMPTRTHRGNVFRECFMPGASANNQATLHHSVSDILSLAVSLPHKRDRSR